MLQSLLELVTERGAHSYTDLAQRLGVSEGATDVHLTLFGDIALVATRPTESPVREKTFSHQPERWRRLVSTLVACLGWNTWRPK